MTPEKEKPHRVPIYVGGATYTARFTDKEYQIFKKIMTEEIISSDKAYQKMRKQLDSKKNSNG